MAAKKTDTKGGKGGKDKGKADSKASASKKAGKAKKKKWSKGKVKEKAENAVYFDPAGYEKLLAEIPTGKLITVSSVCERLKINGSLARQSLRDLHNKGLIKPVVLHSAQAIYTRATTGKA